MTAVDVPPLTDAGARALIAGADGGLQRTLFVEAGAGSGKTTALVDRVVALVEDDVELRHIAAITFTEKAAAELRHRIRTALEERAEVDVHPRWRTAVDQVDAAAISTLHGFAQRLLVERPVEAGLPPAVRVLDEVASDVAFDERWRRLQEEVLADPALERTLLLSLACGVQLRHLRDLVAIFTDSWDLLADRVTWEAVEPPTLDVRPVVEALDAAFELADHCRDDSDGLLARLGELRTYRDRLLSADEVDALELLDHMPSTRVIKTGRKDRWACDIDAVRGLVIAAGDLRVQLRREMLQACLQRLAVVAKTAVLAAAEERRAAGELEFHDLLVMARGLLRGAAGPSVRAALRSRYRRLLLDEVQDTDPIQLDLAVLLASPDPDAGSKSWQEVEIEAGALFFVGDPKQSIYRFRRADVGLFLAARERFGTPGGRGGAPRSAVSLSTNFRTTPAVLDWVNAVFERLIIPVPDAQPAYQPLDAAPDRTHPPVGPAVTLLGASPHDPRASADEVRAAEADDVAATIVRALGEGWTVAERQPDGSEVWRPARLGDITVLLPARTSLPALERALEARGIPYRAETSSLVYATPEVRDLFAAVRAVADPTDELSLVTALRSPLFGCGDDDLVTWKLRHAGSWDLRRPLPEGVPSDHPVAESMRWLGALHRDAVWLTPSEVLDRIVRERRLLELGYADRRPRDLWRRLRFVVDQARGWSEAERGTLREYLDWARRQASDTARVAESVLPETDDDSVRILTIHAAKGLEFPITILSGTSALPQSRGGVTVTWPPTGPPGISLGAALRSREFEAFKPIDEQMDLCERIRLLYVACTRARDHLVVSLHRTARPASGDRTRPSAHLLERARADALATGDMRVGDELVLVDDGATLPVGEVPDVPAPPPLSAWTAARDAALERASRPRTVAATAVADLPSSGSTAGAAEAPPQPALEDADLDEPPRPPGRRRRGRPAGEQLDLGTAAAEAVQARTADEVAAGLAKDPRDLDLPPWLKGRYGTAVGRAVHAVLQTVDLATGDGLDDAVAAQATAEGVGDRAAEVRALAQAALGSPSVRAAAVTPRWRETYVAAPVGARTLEGYIDLLYRDADGLVVVDYKTAASPDALDDRVEGYRLQGAAYAVAVEDALGEPVARVVFVFLTPLGAVERVLPDLRAAMSAVRELLDVAP